MRRLRPFPACAELADLQQASLHDRASSRDIDLAAGGVDHLACPGQRITMQILAIQSPLSGNRRQHQLLVVLVSFLNVRLRDGRFSQCVKTVGM